jgi:hypothetical protein
MNILELSTKLTSIQRLVAQNIAIMCYNIGEDWVFDIECVIRYYHNTPEKFGMRHV